MASPRCAREGGGVKRPRAYRGKDPYLTVRIALLNICEVVRTLFPFLDRAFYHGEAGVTFDCVNRKQLLISSRIAPLHLDTEAVQFVSELSRGYEYFFYCFYSSLVDFGPVKTISPCAPLFPHPYQIVSDRSPWVRVVYESPQLRMISIPFCLSL